jgi:hypothetical protein
MWKKQKIYNKTPKNKMEPEFKMAAKNCFWSRVQNGGLYRDGVFVILK